MSKFKREVKSAVQRAKGRITEAFGRTLKQPAIERKGKTEQALGETRDEIDDAVDRLDGKVEQAMVVALDLVRTAASRVLPSEPGEPKSEPESRTQSRSSESEISTR